MELGLINFTKAVPDVGAPSNILVTAVSPGPVKTDRWDSLQRQQAAGKDLEAFVKEQKRTFPLGRIALPEEVADMVCFLASDRSLLLGGIAITIDGGMSRGSTSSPKATNRAGFVRSARRGLVNLGTFACSTMRTCP